MAATNINRVIITGNLTRDPELRSTNSGLAICSMRIASNTRRKNNQTGQWEDKPNFFDVTVFGAQGENCARFLSKGRPVAIDGRLEWREFTDQQGNNRQAVEIIADGVQFLGGRDDAPQGGGGGGFASRTDVPVNTQDFAAPAPAPAAVPAGAPADDDIPFSVTPAFAIAADRRALGCGGSRSGTCRSRRSAGQFLRSGPCSPIVVLPPSWACAASSPIARPAGSPSSMRGWSSTGSAWRCWCAPSSGWILGTCCTRGSRTAPA